MTITLGSVILAECLKIESAVNDSGEINERTGNEPLFAGVYNLYSTLRM